MPARHVAPRYGVTTLFACLNADFSTPGSRSAALPPALRRLPGLEVPRRAFVLLIYTDFRAATEERRRLCARAIHELSRIVVVIASYMVCLLAL